MAELNIHNFDFQKLIDFASTAKGEVLLKTSEGDILNLKSKLTQLLALSGTVDWGKVGEACVLCSDQDDQSRLFRLNLYGHEETK